MVRRVNLRVGKKWSQVNLEGFDSAEVDDMIIFIAIG